MKPKTIIANLFSDYGMLVVLLLLCVFFSIFTYNQQHPTGPDAAKQLANKISKAYTKPATIMIVTGTSAEDKAFSETLQQQLTDPNYKLITVQGTPRDARIALDKLEQENTPLSTIAANQTSATWGVFNNLNERHEVFKTTTIQQPQPYNYPNFLKADNLLNIANQIAVIAIIAIGMTLVIITAGIDLSVGSLIALSAVITALIIQKLGGQDATLLIMLLGSLGGIAICALSGLFTGIMVTAFRIPPFIVTLGMMLVASGFAYIFANGQSINAVPDSFVWLGRDADLFQIPNAVVLMLLLYAAAHFLMTRTALGRYIYAVGGNEEAARLSGVPVNKVLLFVYFICGALAGVGGVVMASQLKSGAPTYGQMYELYVIAAVVVGGTSLMGGQGRVLGTLIGAFIIAVIQNGMNLLGVESYTQKVVLGLVILAAVWLDTLKNRSTN